MVEIGAGGQIDALRRDQLPQQLARGLVQAFHRPASASRRAYRLGVGADEDATRGHGRIPIGIVAQAGGPLDVLRRGEVDFGGRFLFAWDERVGQRFLIRNHIAAVAPAPL